jgi:hypothetical protein
VGRLDKALRRRAVHPRQPHVSDKADNFGDRPPRLLWPIAVVGIANRHQDDRDFITAKAKFLGTARR